VSITAFQDATCRVGLPSTHPSATGILHGACILIHTFGLRRRALTALKVVRYKPLFGWSLSVVVSTLALFNEVNGHGYDLDGRLLTGRKNVRVCNQSSRSAQPPTLRGMVK